MWVRVPPGAPRKYGQIRCIRFVVWTPRKDSRRRFKTSTHTRRPKKSQKPNAQGQATRAWPFLFSPLARLSQLFPAQIEHLARQGRFGVQLRPPRPDARLVALQRNPHRFAFFRAGPGSRAVPNLNFPARTLASSQAFHSVSTRSSCSRVGRAGSHSLIFPVRQVHVRVSVRGSSLDYSRSNSQQNP